MSLTEPTQVAGVGLDTAAAEQVPSAAVTSTEPAGDELVGQLARLAELHRVGSLTDAEFSSAKSRILQPPSTVKLHMPSRRVVPEIHPIGALRSVTLVLLDQVAKRLGATCRPASETPARMSLEGMDQTTMDQPLAVSTNALPSARAFRNGEGPSREGSSSHASNLD